MRGLPRLRSSSRSDLQLAERRRGANAELKAASCVERRQWGLARTSEVIPFLCPLNRATDTFPGVERETRKVANKRQRLWASPHAGEVSVSVCKM